MYFKVPGPVKLQIAKSRVKNGGYGVYAKKNIRAGEVLEMAPFIEVPRNIVYGQKNLLQDYVFTSHLNKNHVIVVFGYGSMYNHSLKNNAYYRISSHNPNRFLEYVALTDIPRGTEILISYGPAHHVNNHKS
jgi:SET domain-containing protein